MAEPVLTASGPSGQEIVDPSLDALFEAYFHRAANRDGGAPGLRDWVELAEAWRIVHALRSARGNRSAAARALGIGRRTLYTKMEKLGITTTYSIAGAGR